METQTRFDLAAAITKWQEELAAQADLTPIVRRELETHLRDTIAELQKRGLNNEESFWLARRRVGRPEQLGEEFAKADSSQVWRDRAFWIAIFLLAETLWMRCCNPLWMFRISQDHRLQSIMPEWIVVHAPFSMRVLPLLTVLQFISYLARLVPMVVLAFFIGSGRMNFARAMSRFVAASRTRFVMVALALCLVVNLFHYWQLPSLSWVLLADLPWLGSLVAISAWLLRPKKESAMKAA